MTKSALSRYLRNISYSCETEPYFFEFGELKKHVGFKRQVLPCPNCGNDIRIQGLLEGIITAESGEGSYLRVGDAATRMPKIGTTLEEWNYPMLQLLTELIRMSREQKTEVHVHSHHSTDVNVQLNMNINIFHEKMQDFVGTLDNLKDDLLEKVDSPDEKKAIEKEIARVEKAVGKAEQLQKKEDVKKKPGIGKSIRDFLKNMEDTATPIGKTVKTLKEGVGHAQELAEFYNNIAQWVGWPQVPKPFLKKVRSDSKRE